jgi:type IV secretory pathway TraG/TraD family ATPase VirD4
MCWERNWTAVPENYWHKSRSRKRIGWRSRKRKGKRSSKVDGGEGQWRWQQTNKMKQKGQEQSVNICWGITVLAVIQSFTQQCLMFQSPQQETSWQQKTKHAICFGKGRGLFN